MSDEEKVELPKYIRVFANEIYFYCDVSVESVAEFNSELRKMDVDLRIKYMSIGLDSRPDIKVYIHSNGGDLHAGFSAHDHIRNCKSKVITIADGITASAAAIMYLAGHERLMTKNAWILIHQLGTDMCWGNFDEMKEELNNCQKIMKQMCDLCLKLTHLPENKLEKLMHKDVLLSSKKCLKYGITDSIV